MSLANKLQQAWNDQAPWLVLLRPLSLLYRSLFAINKQLYQSGVKQVYRAPVPIMVIGNITVGGSGKTPLIIQLVKHLQAQGVRVGVISRGYGGEGPFPSLVTAEHTAAQVGDEPALIVQETHVPMAVGPNRQASIELLLSKYELDLILSDDGLQHFALARDIEWIVLDGQRGLGNQQLLPEGYLREPATRLEGATVIEHRHPAQTALSMHLAAGQPYCLNPEVLGKHGNAGAFDAQTAYQALVGIGYPERFYRTLSDQGIQIKSKHAFADHYAYTADDLKQLDAAPIITTAKDAVKLQQLLKHMDAFAQPIWVLPVEAQLSNAVYELLEQQLKQFHIQFQKVSS